MDPHTAQSRLIEGFERRIDFIVNRDSSDVIGADREVRIVR